jgi:phosphoribosylformylglycinamidine cyclo-ligase
MAHITGGGFIDNLPRILPTGVGAVINHGTWPVLPIFNRIQSTGQIKSAEMFHVFNMGLGMLIVLSQEQALKAVTVLAGDAFTVGHIISGDQTVVIEGLP